jgi:hemoglobin-like flavoprotein
MQDAAQRLSRVFEQEFNFFLRTVIGIHFGTVILGRIGHPGKRQITVIGDTVNMASHIESMTKELGVPLLVSDSVVAHLPGALRLGPPTEALLKGRAGSTLLYPCEGFSEPDTILLVQSSFDRVAVRSKEFGERFYANLFKANPEVHSLFQNDLAVQTLVKGLNRLHEIEGGLRELGKRHRGYNVTPSDYDNVARALLLTLEEFLADELKPEIRHAWRTVYGTITLTMVEAAED